MVLFEWDLEEEKELIGGDRKNLKRRRKNASG